MIDRAEEDDCKCDKLQNRASVSIDTPSMSIDTQFSEEVDIRGCALVWIDTTKLSIDTLPIKQEIGHQLRIAPPQRSRRTTHGMLTLLIT